MPQGNICLVLGSGGARGMAHIGVIEELIKEGYNIKQVVGCSMGAVVGGIYCAGYLSEYKHWLISLTKLEVFRLLDFTFSSQGFVKGERVFKAIEQLIGDHQIENFRIPFIAVAADLIQKQEVHYRTGSLFKALRASIAIPSVFTPVTEGRSQLVDGGVLNPLPLNLVCKEQGDLVVAVNVNANIPPPRLAAPVVNQERAAYLKMLDAFRMQFLKTDPKQEEQVEKFGFFDLMNRSYDLTLDRLTDLMIDVHKPDLVVNISRDACGVFEFYRANEIIEEGRSAFRNAYERLPVAGYRVAG
ncbi:patatin-like phospholipase family protein [Fulvivirgaceae bacterium PWU4]|uniref:Patatin-like phospholipase family protein n=1 Tax=Chryseosolibacter histidini TaxID=2782349 RepID=A0AAP2GJZ3_9BACT|nr:patatin-like phospholipase family protein [Chryseosolibacter histidini]MBT1698826.1 patatin-like phospholipase family protein [Chryseosolibacter histidini]